MDSLVSTDWVAGEIGAPDLVLLDASWHMTATGRDPRKEFRERHLPGARFFDIDALVDPSAKAPHMLPRGADFASAMSTLGVGSADRIVIYDDSPLHSATRAWFTLRHFGAERVAILDGGLARWLADGRPVERGQAVRRIARFEDSERRDVVSQKDLHRGVDMPILDARSSARFSGAEVDPRPGVAPGHMPGARNLPFCALYREDGTLRPNEEIEQRFAGTGIDPARPFVATCGSGITATSLLFAAHRLGNRDARLYDGSWSEWGTDPATPKSVGPA